MPQYRSSKSGFWPIRPVLWHIRPIEAQTSICISIYAKTKYYCIFLRKIQKIRQFSFEKTSTKDGSKKVEVRNLPEFYDFLGTPSPCYSYRTMTLIDISLICLPRKSLWGGGAVVSTSDLICFANREVGGSNPTVSTDDPLG